jgi:hypothetical protein
VRAVTHLDVDAGDVARAVEAARAALERRLTPAERAPTQADSR